VQRRENNDDNHEKEERSHSRSVQAENLRERENSDEASPFPTFPSRPFCGGLGCVARHGRAFSRCCRAVSLNTATILSVAAKTAPPLVKTMCFSISALFGFLTLKNMLVLKKLNKKEKQIMGMA